MNGRKLPGSLIYLPGLFLLSLVYYYPHLLFGRASFVDDLFHAYFTKSFFSGQILKGVFPLWNPHILSGMPFLADINNAVCYPLNYIFVLLPFPDALTCYFIIHLFLAGAFTYLWARGAGLLPFSGFIAGCIYMLSGVFATENVHLGIFAALSWLPLILLSVDYWVKKKDFFSALYVGGALAIQFLCGAPQIFLITGYIIIFYLIFQCLRLRPVFKNCPCRILEILKLGAGVTLGLMVTAVQLLPSLEFTRLAARWSRTGYDFSSRFSELPQGLFSSPFAQISHAWVGIIALFLAIVAIFMHRGRKVYGFAFLALISADLSLGSRGFLFKFVYYFLPGFSYFRAPYRFIFFSDFFIAILAGIGIEYLLRRYFLIPEVKEAKHNKDYRTIFYLTIGFIAFYAAWGVIVGWLFIGSFRMLIIELVLFFLGLGLFFLSLKGYVGNISFKGIFTLLLIFEITRGSFGLGGVYTLTHKDFFTFREEKDFIDFLSQDKGTFRVWLSTEAKIPCIEYPLIGSEDKYRAFSPNFGEHFQFENIDGYTPLLLKRYYEFRYQVPLKTVLSLLNTRYVVTTQRFQDSSWRTLVFSNGVVNIYGLPNSLPRFFLVHKAKFFAEAQALLSHMKGKEFDPVDMVLLEEPSQARPIPASDERGDEIYVLRRSAQEALIEAQVEGQGGYLVVSEPYFPGWKAVLDGKEVKIMRANYLFRAVYLPGGRHLVRFFYAPFSFRAGLMISLSAIIVILLFIFHRLVSVKRKVKV